MAPNRWKMMLVGGGLLAGSAAALVAAPALVTTEGIADPSQPTVAPSNGTGSPRGIDVPVVTSSPTPSASLLSAQSVGLTVEHRPTSMSIPSRYQWLLPVDEDFSSFPVRQEPDMSLACGGQTGVHCHEKYDPDESSCTPEQNEWLSPRALPQGAWQKSLEGKYVPQNFYLENGDSGGAVMAIDSVESHVNYQPLDGQYIVVECNVYPPPGMGGAAGIVSTRELSVPAQAGQVVYGENNAAESDITSKHFSGSPFVVNLAPGEGADFRPALPIDGPGVVSGYISMKVSVGEEGDAVRLDILPGEDPVTVVPESIPVLQIHGGALCPEGPNNQKYPYCSVSEFMEAQGVGG